MRLSNIILLHGHHTLHPYIILLYGSYTFIPISCFYTDLMLSSLYPSSVWIHTSPLDPQCQSLFPHDASVNFQQATALDITDSWANRHAASACVNPSLGHMFHVKHIMNIDSTVYTFSISPWVGFSMVSRLFSDMFLAFFSFCESKPEIWKNQSWEG